MKTIKNILSAILIGILFLCLIIIVIPFFIIVSPFLWVKDKRFKKEYNEYLQTIEGKNFFCYNNRKNGREYIEEQIIPNLPSEVEVVYLNGRKIESQMYEPKYLSKAFYGFKNYTKFPQLLKIRRGKAIDCSLNSELFNCLNQGKNANEIFLKMNDFFQLKNKTTPPQQQQI